jgi:S1-C subfamily serine protease
MSWYDEPSTGPALPPPAWPPPSVDERPAETPGSAPRKGRSRWALALVVGLVAGAVGGAGTGAVVANHDDHPAVVASAPTTATPGSSTATPRATTTFEQVDVADVVAQVLPAVVSIQTTGVAQGAFGRPVQQQAAGSGFIVSADGVIYTNNHVVEGAEQVQVTLHDGRTLDGRVLGTDANSDLAAVKVDATGLPTLPLGDSTQLRMGDPVIAIGNALALEGGPTVTTGIVSALDRTIDTDNGEHLTHLLQTDAAINPGNSGGPLLNAQGQVVGINTAAAGDAQNVGFAISMDHAKSVLEGLQNGTVAPRPFLGVQTTQIDAQAKQQLNLSVDKGALVIAVTPGSGAENAGIRAGDVITKAGDTTVANPDDLGDALTGAKPGDHLSLTIQRGDQQLTVDAVLGQRPS